MIIVLIEKCDPNKIAIWNLEMQNADAIPKEFMRNGYVVIPGLLSQEEVRAIRNRLDVEFSELEKKSGGGWIETLPPTLTISRPYIYETALRENIVATLRMILEPNYTMFPDLEVHRSLFAFGHTKLPSKIGFKGGWHDDAGSEGFQDYLVDPAYKFVKCGIYLQDNTVEFGGGIDIVEGSHRFPFRTGNNRLDFKIRKVSQKLGILFKSKTVNLKAGDFLAFHYCMVHRGTIPQQLLRDLPRDEFDKVVKSLPKEHTKYVIYNCACHGDYSENYMKHCYRRGINEIALAETGEKSVSAFMSDFPGVQFPEDFPVEFQKLVADRGIVIAALRGKDRVLAVEQRQRMLASNCFVNIP